MASPLLGRAKNSVPLGLVCQISSSAPVLSRDLTSLIGREFMRNQASVFSCTVAEQRHARPGSKPARIDRMIKRCPVRAEFFALPSLFRLLGR